MDIETRPSATETAQCIAGMSEKVAANPLDSDFIAEQTRIFRNAWVPVCHESELPAPYDFRTASICLLYTSPSPRDYAASRMPSSA